MIHVLHWDGLSLGDWPSLAGMSRGFDLKQQLETAQPALVLGEGQRLFAITPDTQLLEAFRTLLEA